jgi:hypothetical protein
MYRPFAFEGDTHASLACVPLVVRRKLDLAGLKISLAGWQALSREERLALCHLPVDDPGDLAVYREVLTGFASRAGAPLTPLAEGPSSPSQWTLDAVRARVAAKLGGADDLDAGRLAALTEEERYALFKLADPKREPGKLVAAMTELGLRGGAPDR